MSDKILIIQLKRAGDVVVTTPIAALLKRRWPKARVDFLVDPGYAPLLEHNPAIDQVLKYQKKAVLKTLAQVRSERYDLILDFQCSPRSAVVAATSGADRTAGYRVPFWGMFYKTTVKRPGSRMTVVQGKVSLLEAVAGAFSDVPEPRVFLSAEERNWGQHAMQNGRGVIGLVPTSLHASRRWSEASFAALARLLDQAGYSVWLFWGPGEREFVDRVAAQTPTAQVIPSTSLREMAALLSRCDAVISNTNGPMHIAAAVGVPTVTIYGPTDPLAWDPGGPRSQVMQAKDVGCLGCNLSRCPFGHECMTGVTPAAVLAACKDLLGRTRKPISV